MENEHQFSISNYIKCSRLIVDKLIDGIKQQKVKTSLQNSR